MRKAKLMIGISGAQGAGKSTLLQAMAELGYHVDGFKVSRLVQAEFGWTELRKVETSPELMMRFQREVFRQKKLNDTKVKAFDTTGIILTERTFADLYAYTKLWTLRFTYQGKLPVDEAEDFLAEYLADCVEAQSTLYEGVVLLPLMSHIQWETDPNRASEHDAEQVYNVVQSFVQEHEAYNITISTETVQDRAQEVQTFIRSL